MSGSNGELTRQGIVEVDCDAIRLLDPSEAIRDLFSQDF